ncbi:MAG: DinB family protein [Nocardioides sp.]|uniref:DinB family protein n=1 Tax=Nocardioides sp. TaxID=35761 RepID=UPI00238AF477|nr:DinB family protein [Nocardioides sp.]MDE0775891.1 DinB family protein [Nocardioides sp.]
MSADTADADERTLLESRLDQQRSEIAAILERLDETQARARLVPSLTTPLGLVKHATFVERVWLHSRVAGVPRDELAIPDTVEESFVLDEQDTVASVLTSYAAVCDRSRTIAAEHDLDEEFAWHGRSVSLRFVYGHLIAELARHAGHGDILVELLLAESSSSLQGGAAGPALPRQ